MAGSKGISDVNSSFEPSPSKMAGSRRGTQSVERVLNILQAFTPGEPFLTAAELCRKLGANKSTVHRLTGILEDRGFLWRDSKTRAFSLGPTILEFVGMVLDRNDISSLCLPYMAVLRDQTKETVGLNIRIGNQRACIAQVESPHELRMRLDIGRLLPLSCGAASKVLLANMNPNEIEQIVRQTKLEKLGPGSIQDPEELLRQLDTIRRQGFAVSKEERIAGGITIAAPVRNRVGQIVASVSVYGPLSRVDTGRIMGWVPFITHAVKSISRELGYLAPWPGDELGGEPPSLTQNSGNNP
jgi:DNA-binding IclR family transcriptional regulator